LPPLLVCFVWLASTLVHAWCISLSLCLHRKLRVVSPFACASFHSLNSAPFSDSQSWTPMSCLVQDCIALKNSFLASFMSLSSPSIHPNKHGDSDNPRPIRQLVKLEFHERFDATSLEWATAEVNDMIMVEDTSCWLDSGWKPSSIDGLYSITFPE
jgi:hypothetical protein